MKLIKFRRLNKDYWEIAFNEKHLFEKLNGDMAEIEMPSKPWYIRLWRKFFPLKGQEISSDRITYINKYGYRHSSKIIPQLDK